MKGKRVKWIVIIVVILLIAFLCPYRVVWNKEQTTYADLPDYHIKALFGSTHVMFQSVIMMAGVMNMMAHI